MPNLNTIRRIIRNRQSLVDSMKMQRSANELEISNLNDLIRCYNSNLSQGKCGTQVEVVKEQLREYVHFRAFLISENDRLLSMMRCHKQQINNEVLRINWFQRQHFKQKALGKQGNKQ